MTSDPARDARQAGTAATGAPAGEPVPQPVPGRPPDGGAPATPAPAAPESAATPAAAPGSAGTRQARRHQVKRSRVGGVWVAAVLFAVVLLLLLIFILENGHRVAISFFGAQGHLPLGVALLLAAVLGVLLVVIPGTARILQLRFTARRIGRTGAGAAGGPGAR